MTKKFLQKSWHVNFIKFPNVEELVEPFIIFQVVTKDTYEVVWNEIDKDAMRCLEWSKEEVETEDKEFPMKGYKRITVWERLRKKYVNTIPKIVEEGRSYWFYYIKL